MTLGNFCLKTMHQSTNVAVVKLYSSSRNSQTRLSIHNEWKSTESPTSWTLEPAPILFEKCNITATSRPCSKHTFSTHTFWANELRYVYLHLKCILPGLSTLENCLAWKTKTWTKYLNILQLLLRLRPSNCVSVLTASKKLWQAKRKTKTKKQTNKQTNVPLGGMFCIHAGDFTYLAWREK